MSQALPSASQIAAFLVRLSANVPESEEFLCNMRLQKLLYYVQGWSLALRSRPAFSERVEAWALGPVVPEIYRRFKEKGGAGISPADVEAAGEPELSAEDEQFVSRVWETYKDYSAISLSRMSHEEAPWNAARGSLLDGERSKNEITHESMRDFFAKFAAT